MHLSAQLAAEGKNTKSQETIKRNKSCKLNHKLKVHHRLKTKANANEETTNWWVSTSVHGYRWLIWKTVKAIQ